MDRVSTGSFAVNDWLEGGYERGIVTMIAGPSASGKTNFATLAACSSAREKRVVFVDTEGGFSTERVRQIVGEENMEKILSKIMILNPTTFEEQNEAFSQLLKYMTGDEIGLIVVDSIVMLYRLELGEATQRKDLDRVSQLNRDIAKQMRTLVEIARKRKIPVVVTNQVYNSFLSFEEQEKGAERKTNIVGGDLFKYWSKCIIELKNNDERKAVLLRHRDLGASEFCFEIKNEGIVKKNTGIL